MGRPVQFSFAMPAEFAPRKEHGGSLSVGRRKRRRPLALKKSHHVIMRSEKAAGVRRLTRHSELIHRVLRRAALLFNVRIYKLAIASNHLHVSVRGKKREDLQNFFRVAAGHIAQGILREFPLAKDSSVQSARRFWNHLLYSRIVEWGREFRRVIAYIHQNTLEAEGIIPFQPRRRRFNTS
jgi:putative transposase